MERFIYRNWAAFAAILSVCPHIVAKWTLHKIAPRLWGRDWRGTMWSKSATIDSIFDTLASRY